MTGVDVQPGTQWLTPPLLRSAWWERGDEVLDDDGNPARPGVEGEMYMSGPILAAIRP